MHPLSDARRGKADYPLLLAYIRERDLARETEALGAGDSRLGLLDTVQVVLGNLPGDKLGATMGYEVLIDSNAAGYGWFADPTPADNSEFLDGATPTGIDLLTVVMHEMGHVLGYGDVAGDSGAVMSATLEAGVRYAPQSAASGSGTTAEAGKVSRLVSFTARKRVEGLAFAQMEAGRGWLADFLTDGVRGADPNARIKIEL